MASTQRDRFEIGALLSESPHSDVGGFGSPELPAPEHLTDVAGQGADELQVFGVVVPICSGFAALVGDGGFGGSWTSLFLVILHGGPRYRAED